jgi:tetratricopeptide (TPR) repeat protein
VELWCLLAYLSELINNKNEADECIQKAGALVESGKHPTNKEIACYENYLGYILYGRGQIVKGLEHVKRSVDIDPNPARVAEYEKTLAEVSSENNRADSSQTTNKSADV